MMKQIGRKEEEKKIQACIELGRNVLIEGPVGVGKTFLVLSIAKKLKRPFFRIDGDGRYSEQKLSGWFDPPTVMKKGYSVDAFVPGPLVQAMQAGGILFINELNRMPEGVQNILLPAIDEKMLVIPRYGEVKAKPGFIVIATQNPKEFVATSHLSEAILDRFEWIYIDYPNFRDEFQIVLQSIEAVDTDGKEEIAELVTTLVRGTRFHKKIRRGASIRAGIAVAELAAWFKKDSQLSTKDAVMEAALLALPTRIELEKDDSDTGSSDDSFKQVLLDCFTIEQGESNPNSPEKKSRI